MKILRFAGALVGALTLAACVTETPVPPTSAGAVETEWRVESAPGLDAIFLLSAATGDRLQERFYADEIAWVQSNLDSDALEAFQGVADTMRDQMDLLPGPALALAFSGCSYQRLEQVIAAAEDPSCIQAALQGTPYYDPETWPGIESGIMPAVAIALNGLDAAGYKAWYAKRFGSTIAKSVAEHKTTLAPYDVVPANERYLGRELDPEIYIVLMKFTGSYGARMLGQRFVTRYDYAPEIQLRTATHEFFHPPFDEGDPELWELLEPIETDPWVASIVENADPVYGYKTFRAIVDEDSAQALEQLVSERLGFAVDPGEEWAENDGGMHMFAAALYHAMIEDSFAQSGGVYHEWLKSALRRGVLAPGDIRRRAAEVVGEEAVAHWDP